MKMFNFAVLSGDALSDGRRFHCPRELRSPYLYVPDFIHRLQKILFVEKKSLVEKVTFFITENFLGVSNSVCGSLCAEALISQFDTGRCWVNIQ